MCPSCSDARWQWQWCCCSCSWWWWWRRHWRTSQGRGWGVAAPWVRQIYFWGQCVHSSGSIQQPKEKKYPEWCLNSKPLGTFQRLYVLANGTDTLYLVFITANGRTLTCIHTCIFIQHLWSYDLTVLYKSIIITFLYFIYYGYFIYLIISCILFRCCNIWWNKYCYLFIVFIKGKMECIPSREIKCPKFGFLLYYVNSFSLLTTWQHAFWPD